MLARLKARRDLNNTGPYRQTGLLIPATNALDRPYPIAAQELAAVCAIALTGFAAACSRDPKARKTGYLKSGDSYVQQGKFAEAILQYRNAVQADPLDGDARLKLAETYSKNHDGANAAREYVRAADVLTNRVDVQLKAGALLLIGGRFDDAKVRAEKALALSADDVDAHILLGNALAGLKNIDGAITEVQEAIRLAPARASSYSNLGELEARRGNAEAAEKALKKGVELDERSAATVNTGRRWQRAEAERSSLTALALDRKRGRIARWRRRHGTQPARGSRGHLKDHQAHEVA
jgi:tetratricopeptide (TPR) repeat protein